MRKFSVCRVWLRQPQTWCPPSVYTARPPLLLLIFLYSPCLIFSSLPLAAGQAAHYPQSSLESHWSGLRGSFRLKQRKLVRHSSPALAHSQEMPLAPQGGGMPALTCLRQGLCKGSGKARLASMALGHLDHEGDFPFTCCIRLRIRDVNWKKRCLWHLWIVKRLLWLTGKPGVLFKCINKKANLKQNIF